MSSDYANALKTELVTVVNTALCQLDRLWVRIGVEPGQQRMERTRAFVQDVASLLNEMVAEEQALSDSLERTMKSYEQRLTELCSELNVPVLLEIEDTSSLLDQEKAASRKIEELTEDKNKRLLALASLNKALEELREKLGMEPVCLPTQTSVPSREQLQELEDAVSALEQERAKRFAELLGKRADIVETVTLLALKPSGPFETEFILGEPENFRLSKSYMDAVSALQEKMKKKLAEQRATASLLRNKLVALWRLCGTSQSEQEGFLAIHGGHSAAAVDAIKTEIIRCEGLKFKRREAMRSAISELWAACHFGAQQQSCFKEFTSDEWNGKLLAAHEQEIKRLEALHAENCDLYTTLNEYNDYCRLRLQHTQSQNDTSRWTNRGAQLIKEEKERNRVSAELPKLEAKLERLVEARKQNDCLLVYDMTVMDYCRSQSKCFRQEKKRVDSSKPRKST